MISKLAFEGSKNISNIFKLNKYNKEFKESHPDYFDPERITCFLRFSRRRKDFVSGSICT